MYAYTMLSMDKASNHIDLSAALSDEEWTKKFTQLDKETLLKIKDLVANELNMILERCKPGEVIDSPKHHHWNNLMTIISANIRSKDEIQTGCSPS